MLLGDHQRKPTSTPRGRRTSLSVQTLTAHLSLGTVSCCRSQLVRSQMYVLIITLRASEAAAQCIVIGPVCLWVGVCLCIDPHQTGFVGEGSDHLQLIKIWPSRAPGNGVCGGVKIFGSTLLQPVYSVCVSCECYFIHFCSSAFDPVNNRNGQTDGQCTHSAFCNDMIHSIDPAQSLWV